VLIRRVAVAAVFASLLVSLTPPNGSPRVGAGQAGLFSVRVVKPRPRLVFDLAGRSLITLSHDRRQALLRTGNGELALARIGGATRPVVSVPYPVEGAALSPDGSMIAFEVVDSSACQPQATGCAEIQLWLAESSGGEPRRFSRRARSPAWSPDSRRLAFVGHYSSYDDAGQVSVTRLGGGRGRAIEPYGHAADLSWAPRGGRLAYTGPGESGSVRVALAANGRGPNLGPGRRPVWSPEGRRIAFVRRAGKRQALFVTRPGLRPSYRAAIADSIWDVAWSPDGRSLAFVRGIQGHRAVDMEIVVVGTGPRPIEKRLVKSGPGSVIGHIFWSRDGKSLLYEQRLLPPNQR
jgi:Tol biopolymer transport system component